MAARTKSKKKPSKKPASDYDTAFLMKLILYVILGSLWVKVTKSGSELAIPIPIGLAIGLIFTRHEHFAIDRKIDYAVLIIAALVGFMAPYGIFITL